MITHGPDQALKLRALAARFRALAVDTDVEPYHHKFEETASELEDAAAAEDCFCPDLRRVS
jgi:hypothetical protein